MTQFHIIEGAIGSSFIDASVSHFVRSLGVGGGVASQKSIAMILKTRTTVRQREMEKSRSEEK